MSHAKYPNRPGEPQDVLALLNELKEKGDHLFWPDDISLADPLVFDLRQASKANDLTDIYLLGLAKSKSGKLATFDRRVRSAGVVAGLSAIQLIDPSPTPPPP